KVVCSTWPQNRQLVFCSLRCSASAAGMRIRRLSHCAPIGRGGQWSARRRSRKGILAGDQRIVVTEILNDTALVSTIFAKWLDIKYSIVMALRHGEFHCPACCRPTKQYAYTVGRPRR